MTGYRDVMEDMMGCIMTRAALALLITLASHGHSRSSLTVAEGHLEPTTEQLLSPPEYGKRPRSRGISKAIRQKVFKRDHYICQICGRRYPEQHLVPNHIDHNIRHNKVSDLETTCAGCNMQEGMIYARLLREAGPRSLVSEEKRLQIVKEARKIVKEQVPHKGWRKVF